MKEIDLLFGKKPFSLNKEIKRKYFFKALNKLYLHHKKNSDVFKKIDKIFSYKKNNINLSKFPFIPVSLFKKYDLKSLPDNKIHKVLKSSGTSSNLLSKIFLDKKTSFYQTKILSSIGSNFLGKERIPMLVFDNVKSSQNKDSYTARKAAIIGFSIFAKNTTYILDEHMKVDFNILNKFLEKHKSQKFLIFGFTSILWDAFFNQLNKHKFDLRNAILLHGGGWKKLENLGIKNIDFKNFLKKNFKLNNVINYYGMVEQTGSIFFECNEGYFHSSIYSEVIIRDKNFNVISRDQKGIIQLISLLPWSYPGISIITEDVGEIKGEDDCKCGRLGKYFLVHGRIKNAELRGCSDVN